MVDHAAGQLYTIEGIAAALIMLVTAWIVLGTTTMYTPGDTHISDMQLEQLGTDALAMMDTPNDSAMNRAFQSNLAEFIKNDYGSPSAGPANFSSMFLAYADTKTGGKPDSLQYIATVYYRNQSTPAASYEFSKTRNLTAGDHAVRVTRWVYINNTDNGMQSPAGVKSIFDHPSVNRGRLQVVLVEVLLWRG